MFIKFVHSELQALGLEYLSAVLKQHGHSTELVVDPYFPFLNNLGKFSKWISGYNNSLINKIFDRRPDLIAFSITSYNIEWASRLALRLKELSTVQIVFGGVQATLIPEVLLEKGVADFVILGEGEQAFLELVEHLKNGDQPWDINNVWMRRQGRLIKNPLRNLVGDLDSLPFADKDLVPYWLNRGLYRIITGRGCPGDCSYCAVSGQRKIYKGKGKFIRRRSVDNVINELAQAKAKYKIKRVLFEDDLFTSDREWVAEFAQRYKSKIGLPCFLHATPQTIDQQAVDCLKQMRCYAVEVGVQSLNPTVREQVLNRHYSNAQIEQAITLLKTNGIHCICDNIIGLPQQSPDDLLEMIKFYTRINSGKVEVLRLEYYPQAAIIDKAELDQDQRNSISQGESVVSKDNSSKEVNKLMLVLGANYIFSNRIISFILGKKLYRFFPAVNDFNHLNEFIFYLSALFRPQKSKAFISFRADILYKMRYILSSNRCNGHENN